MSKKTGMARRGWVKIAVAKSLKCLHQINIYPNTLDEQKTKIARTSWVKINIYPNTFDEQKTGIAGAGWVKIAVARIIAASGGCRPRFCCTTTHQASALFTAFPITCNLLGIRALFYHFCISSHLAVFTFFSLFQVSLFEGFRNSALQFSGGQHNLFCAF